MDAKRTVIFMHDYSRMNKDAIVRMESDRHTFKSMMNNQKSINLSKNETLLDEYFNIFVISIKKTIRSINEIPIIVSYLNTMKEFVNMLQKFFDNYNDLINIMASTIKYEFHESNRLLFRTGKRFLIQVIKEIIFM